MENATEKNDPRIDEIMRLVNPIARDMGYLPVIDALKRLEWDWRGEYAEKCRAKYPFLYETKTTPKRSHHCKLSQEYLLSISTQTEPLHASI